jgi:ubiquinone/menaquinone biosynthesis C-methylase UbiE
MGGWQKKRKIMQRYDVTASIYDRRYGEEQASKMEAALKHLEIGGTRHVLDVGCGTGLFFKYAAEAEGVVGLDVSRKSLLIAKEQAKISRNVFLVLADVDNMPLKTAVFSHVFAFTVIQNTPDPSKTLGELKRVAEEDAVFVVTGLKRIFSREAFEMLLHDAGLSVMALEDGNNLECYVAICARIRHGNRALFKLNYI